MNILMYGEDSYLLNHQLNKLCKKYGISEESMNLSIYDLNDDSMDDIIDDAITVPFFSENKMVVVKNPLFITTSKNKNVSDDDINRLLDYLSVNHKETILVFYLNGKKLDQRKKVTKSIKKACKVMPVEKLSSHELYATIGRSFKSRKVTIEDDALQLFIDRIGDDLQELSNEVEKLSLYKDHISVEDVEMMIPRRIEDDVFELTNAYMRKDLDATFRIYQDLMIRKEEPVKLIVLISQSLRLLYQVKLLDRKGYNDQEIGSILSINPYRLKYIRQNNDSFDLNEILEKMDQLSSLDIAIKTGKMDRFKGLELFLLEMSR